MKNTDSQAGLVGFGSPSPAVPDRGAVHSKHRGRKASNKHKHGGGRAKLRRKRA